MNQPIQDILMRPKGRVRLTFRDAAGNIVDVQEQDNLVVDAGLALHLSALVDPSVSTRITYIETGTGTNAPAAGDVALQTPLERVAISSWGKSGATITATAYYSFTQSNGTVREAGLFIGGSITPGTGTLFSRVALNKTKTISDTLTIEWTITLANA